MNNQKLVERYFHRFNKYESKPIFDSFSKAAQIGNPSTMELFIKQYDKRTIGRHLKLRFFSEILNAIVHVYHLGASRTIIKVLSPRMAI